MRLLDLFSGIGGFSLGLERAGFQTVAFCEIDPFCRAVLRKHWPHVPIYEDIRELTAERLAADGIAVDAICGGFPCQDVSKAGRQAGIAGSRSGLWSEYKRLISTLGPEIVVVENVSGLLSGPSDKPGEWFGTVLGDLASIGFDAEWHCIPAGSIGAPHIRDRVWIVADSHSPRRTQLSWGAEIAKRSWLGTIGDTSRWETEPSVGRLADGLPRDLDRWRRRSIEAYGNAVVPQIPEIIGRAIIELVKEKASN